MTYSTINEFLCIETKQNGNIELPSARINVLKKKTSVFLYLCNMKDRVAYNCMHLNAMMCTENLNKNFLITVCIVTFTHDIGLRKIIQGTQCTKYILEFFIFLFFVFSQLTSYRLYFL